MLFRVDTREHIFNDNANRIIPIKTEQPIGVQVLSFRGFGYARQDLIEPHVDEISLASKSQLDSHQQVDRLQRFLKLSQLGIRPFFLMQPVAKRNKALLKGSVPHQLRDQQRLRADELAHANSAEYIGHRLFRIALG